MSESVEGQKVKIDPIGCYKQAFKLVEGKYWLLMGISVAGMLIGGAVPIVLIGPFTCGVYLCFLEQYRGGDFEFGDLFRGFDYFVPSLIVSLILFGVAMLIIMPGCLIAFALVLVSTASAAADGGQAGASAIAGLGPVVFVLLLLFFLVLAMVACTFFMFAFPLIVDRKLDGTAAVAQSARAVAKNFGGVFGLTLINTLLGIVGAMACYVGSFFLIPISFAAMTIAYRKVFPEIGDEPLSLAPGTSTPEPPGPAPEPGIP